MKNIKKSYINTLPTVATATSGLAFVFDIGIFL
jgi:hypothetical protein